MRIGISLGLGASQGSSVAVAPSITGLGTSTLDRFDGAGGVSLGVTGTGFTGASVVSFGGTPCTTAFNSSTSLTATVPNTLFWENGVIAVTVSGAAGSQNFTITQPAYLEYEIRLDKSGFTNGQALSAISDVSGKGDANRNLAQATGAAQPSFTATDAAYNNQPTAAFDGARYMATGTWTSPPVAPVRHYFVAKSAPFVSSTYMFSGIASGNRNDLNIQVSTTIALYAGSAFATSSLWDGQSKAVAVCEFNGATSKFSKSAKTLTALGTNPGTAAMTGVTLMAVFNAGAKTTGTFARHMVVSSTITTAQHGEIMDYLGTTYGISIAA